VREACVGAEQYTVEELEKIKTIVQNRSRWCQEQGAAYALFIAPLKHEIYPEKLPPYLKKKRPQNKVDQVYQYLREHTDVKVIDVRPTLKAYKEKTGTRLYYRTDTHWNQLGGFLAYQHIMKSLERDSLVFDVKNLDDYTLKHHKEYTGDLSRIITYRNMFYREPVFMIPQYTIQAKEVSLSEPVMKPHFLAPPLIRETQDTTAPRLCMFRDSFGEYLYPHLSEHFSRSTYYWTRSFDRTLVKKEKPDIVVQELLGRFVDTLLDEDVVE
jgi:hypothetical protein